MTPFGACCLIFITVQVFLLLHFFPQRFLLLSLSSGKGKLRLLVFACQLSRLRGSGLLCLPHSYRYKKSIYF